MQIIPTAEISAEVVQAKQRLGIVGNTPALLEAVQRAIKVAPIDLSVLVTGESGTGKEFFPQIIHQFSARKHSKYIAVNCGAIPEGTIDSELFGHEKGSFTGAVASRKGYFEEADGGTIFLDEVAELPLTTQARLLRVLETGEFLKVGSSTVQRTNIRIVAATNVDMAQAVAQGRFREDLYYRLSTIQITIPALRDRGNDVLLLARKFAADFSEKYRTPAITFDDDSRRMLLGYTWPGNVRQLKNVVEQVSLFEAGTIVTAEALRQYLPADAPHVGTETTAPALRGASAYDRERDMLLNLIFRLQHEIEDLRARVDGMSADTKIGRAPLSLDQPLDKPMPTSLVKMSDTVGPAVIDIDARDVAPAKQEPDTPAPSKDTPDTLADNEREMIRRALLRNDGKRKIAAKELNISERTLYRKIKEYKLE